MCSDPHGEFGGMNCLIERQGLDASRRAVALSEEDAQAALATAREKLHGRRAQRPRPSLDDKVLYLTSSP